MRMYYKSIEVVDCYHITKQTDCNFIFLLQHAVLSGLKEAGQLNEMQHRHAETKLLQQYREDVRTYVEQPRDD